MKEPHVTITQSIFSMSRREHVAYLFWAVLNPTNGVGLFGDEFCLKYVPSSSIYQLYTNLTLTIC